MITLFNCFAFLYLVPGENFPRTQGWSASDWRVVLERPGVESHRRAAQVASLWSPWLGARGQAGMSWSQVQVLLLPEVGQVASTLSDSNCH